jgi:phytoene/squalene synthetase
MQARARPIDASYKAMIEEMIGIADASYRVADEAIPQLPAAFGRSVAVASAVYSDIHRRIRANGYDNLRRRAHTTSLGKVVTGARALLNMQGLTVSTPQPVPGEARARA